MKAIANRPLIEEWEFHTRLGILRPTLKRIISAWPDIDDSSDGSDEFLAINNCLNEICHGIDIPPTEWRDWFLQSREEVKKTYGKWLRLGGHSAGGIR